MESILALAPAGRLHQRLRIAGLARLQLYGQHVGLHQVPRVGQHGIAGLVQAEMRRVENANSSAPAAPHRITRRRCRSFFGAVGPAERLGVGIAMGRVLVYGFDPARQVDGQFAAQPVDRDVAKEALHHAQPLRDMGVKQMCNPGLPHISH